MTRSRTVALAVALVVQLALLGVVAGPRLVVRATGTEYRLATEPVDPIDPFRGAYVDLRLRGVPRYTDLRGSVFVALKPVAGRPGVLRGSGALSDAPDSGPYLRCDADDDGEISCGIESLFAPQDDARRLGATAGDGSLVVRVKVGLGGRAVLVGPDGN